VLSTSEARLYVALGSDPRVPRACSRYQRRSTRNLLLEEEAAAALGACSVESLYREVQTAPTGGLLVLCHA
jgi:hypothetical protein